MGGEESVVDARKEADRDVAIVGGVDVRPHANVGVRPLYVLKSNEVVVWESI